MTPKRSPDALGASPETDITSSAESVAERGPNAPDAPERLASDDQQTVVREPTIAHIVERIRARSKRPSVHAQDDLRSPPFARSSRSEIVGNQTLPPSRTASRSVCYTDLLQSRGDDPTTTVWKAEGNGREGCLTY